jgi:hypothetical protein
MALTPLAKLNFNSETFISTHKHVLRVHDLGVERKQRDLFIGSLNTLKHELSTDHGLGSTPTLGLGQ